MPDLPKLKVRRAWNPEEETVAMDEARSFLFSHGPDMTIIVEGQVIYSYEELIEIVSQEPYKEKDFLEVVMIPRWPVGG